MLSEKRYTSVKVRSLPLIENIDFPNTLLPRFSIKDIFVVSSSTSSNGNDLRKVSTSDKIKYLFPEYISTN